MFCLMMGRGASEHTNNICFELAFLFPTRSAHPTMAHKHTPRINTKFDLDMVRKNAFFDSRSIVRCNDAYSYDVLVKAVKFYDCAV